MNSESAIEVRLRDVEPEDLPWFFEQQADPEAVRMAQVAPRDREAFHAHWSRILADPSLIVMTIMYGDLVAGYVACWPDGEDHMVGYWIAREVWGRGVATRALSAFLALMPLRPLTAYVAEENVASRRVLEKCGFTEHRDGSRQSADGVVERVMVLADA